VQQAKQGTRRDARGGKAGSARGGRGEAGSRGCGNPAEQPLKGKAAAPKWKTDSENFRAQLRNARKVTDAIAAGRDLKDLPPPEPTYDPSLVPCPHCGRRFNEKAAERHIPKCNDIKAKPSMLKRGAGVGAHVRTNAAAFTAPLPKSASKPSVTARRR